MNDSSRTDNSLTKSDLIDSLARNQNHLAQKDVELAAPEWGETPNPAMQLHCVANMFRTSSRAKSSASVSMSLRNHVASLTAVKVVCLPACRVPIHST